MISSNVKNKQMSRTPTVCFTIIELHMENKIMLIEMCSTYIDQNCSEMSFTGYYEQKVWKVIELNRYRDTEWFE